MRKHERSWSRGLLAGLADGLIGTVVMTEFQTGMKKASEKLKNGNADKKKRKNRWRRKEEKEDATMKAAGKIAAFAGHNLSREEKKKAGRLVHYSFGTLQGAIYGVVREATGGGGGVIPSLIFGAALFSLADEVAVPALGLSGKPTDYPVSTHLSALASHIVYGLSTEAARRGLRAAL